MFHVKHWNSIFNIPNLRLSKNIECWILNFEYFYENNNVVINFPYKECVLVGGQDNDDKKRKEIFWNTILAPEQVDTLLEPKLLTNFKKYEL